MSKNKVVQLRGGFSDRNKIKPLNTQMQLNDLDNRTRVKILNTMSLCFSNENAITTFHSDKFNEFYSELFNEVIGEVGYFEAHKCYKYDILFENYVQDIVLNNDYDEVLTFVEWFADACGRIILENNKQRKALIELFNKIFEQEYVGCRFVDGIIVPITDEIEMNAIEKCMTGLFDGCKTHFEKALKYLSDRNSPDYKNSIKESISAVESICCIIAGKEQATLGDALNILQRENKLSNQLKAGFEKLYAYTNTEGGIRHAEGLFVKEVSFEEAKYMLVSCCAFVNYLKAEYGKIKP